MRYFIVYWWGQPSCFLINTIPNHRAHVILSLENPFFFQQILVGFRRVIFVVFCKLDQVYALITKFLLLRCQNVAIQDCFLFEGPRKWKFAWNCNYFVNEKLLTLLFEHFSSESNWAIPRSLSLSSPRTWKFTNLK